MNISKKDLVTIIDMFISFEENNSHINHFAMRQPILFQRIIDLLSKELIQKGITVY